MKKHLRMIVIFAICAAAIPLSAMAEDLGFDIIKTHPGDVECILAEDLDHDGNTDIIYSGLMGQTYIIYGSSDDSFEEPIFLQPYSQAILATDFINNDTLIDIIICHNTRTCILINEGNREYSEDSLTTSFMNLGGVATGYFNNDDFLDIFIGPNHIFLGDGSGSFPQQKLIDNGYFQTAYVSDFNNDGIDDMVLLNHYGTAGIYLNDGNANFNLAGNCDLGGLTLGITNNIPVADFNNDNNADFAFVTPHVGPMTNSMITVGYGDGVGGIMDIDTIRVYGASYSMSIADVDRDNNLDLVASDATNHSIVMSFGDGTGNYTNGAPVDYKTDSVMHAMTSVDFDRDGNPDFVAGAFWADSIVIALNTLPDQPILEQTMSTTGFTNVSVGVENPNGFRISKNVRTVAGADYRRLDINNDNQLDAQAVDYNLQYGDYKIILTKKLDAEPDATFSSSIFIGDEEFILFKDYTAPPLTAKISGGYESDSIVIYYTVEPVSSISPANGETIDTDFLGFDWSGLIGKIPSSSIYIFQLSNYHDFRSVLYNEIVEDTEFTLPDILSGDKVYYWRIAPIFPEEEHVFSNTFAVYFTPKPTDIDDDNIIVPDQFSLSQNYPNPFNPSTQIDYHISKRSTVEISVFNLIGQKIKVIENRNMTAGQHSAVWDGTDEDGNSVAGGIYFYRLKAGDFKQTKKMLLLK